MSQDAFERVCQARDAAHAAHDQEHNVKAPGDPRELAGKGGEGVGKLGEHCPMLSWVRTFLGSVLVSVLDSFLRSTRPTTYPLK